MLIYNILAYIQINFLNLKPNYPSDVSEFLTIIALHGEKPFIRTLEMK